MEGTTTDNTSQLPNWFIKLCKWIWKRQKFFWSTVILGVILNLFATWLFTPLSTDYKKLPIWWILQNSTIIWFTGVFLLLLTFVVYMGSRFKIDITIPNKTPDEPVTDPYKRLKQRYLNRMIRDNETLTLKGIPDGLIDRGVQLDEVFIPLQFRPSQPLTEYPLTERELKCYRDGLESGVYSEEMQRVIFEAEKSWFQRLGQNNRITIVELWQGLSVKHPAAVIQGFPGMGKSTLMSRLVLHMARRSLSIPDPTMPDLLEAPLIPVFLSLGRYAIRLAEAKNANLVLPQAR